MKTFKAKKNVEPVLSPDISKLEGLSREALELLKQLIAIPSFSREEDKTAELIAAFLTSKHVEVLRKHNNVWCFNKHFDPALPLVLLNSHHDTVKPVAGYSLDPFDPQVREGRLYGLGSNDAGGALVSLLMTFLHFHEQEGMRFNLAFAATAEEEISGINGISSIIGGLGKIELAIVGEPTKMDMAIAEKGLMVLDCVTRGTAGHAAHNTGDNAIYKTMNDLHWFRNYQFDKCSALLGPVRMTVTQIRAGSQHNVVPALCEYTVDVRTTDAMTNEEVLEIISSHVDAEVTPRSLRLKPSFISADHAFVMAGKSNGCETYGSPTISDQALLDCPSVKMGPGDSTRSHSSDEYIEVSEITAGISTYIKTLNQYLFNEQNTVAL